MSARRSDGFESARRSDGFAIRRQKTSQPIYFADLQSALTLIYMIMRGIANPLERLAESSYFKESLIIHPIA